jgi:hypothetical protein
MMFFEVAYSEDTRKSLRIGEKMSIRTTSSSSIVAPCQNARWKMQNVARICDPLLAAYRKQHRPLFDHRYLLVRVVMRGRYNPRCESQPADHHVFTDNHLPFDTFADIFNRDS